ncbi:MAG: hypothetical protein ABIK73_07130 [candidate division WOR-3 bacterium]
MATQAPPAQQASVQQTAASATNTLIDLVSAIYNTFAPYIQQYLGRYGLIKYEPGKPVPAQITMVVEFGRKLAASSAAAQEDVKEIVLALEGIGKSISPEFDSSQNPEVRQQIENVAHFLVGIYPYIYQLPGGYKILSYVNPFSRVVLANELADKFSIIPSFYSKDEIVAMASRAAVEIMSDPRKHKGFTSAQIAEIASAAYVSGLITARTPEEFLNQLVETIDFVAPIRYLVYVTGKQDEVDIPKIIDFARQIQARFPYATRREISQALWMNAEIARTSKGQDLGRMKLLTVANIEGMEPILDRLRYYIRHSKMTLEQLNEYDEKLTLSAANSYLGSAIGALIRAVRNGLIKRGPAMDLYNRVITGQPLPIISPIQIGEAMVASGLEPNAAMIMLTQYAINRMYHTPLSLVSARLTQWQVSWLPRFAVIERMIPGNDPVSRSIKEGYIAQLAEQAGIPYGAFRVLLSPEYAAATVAVNRIVGQIGLKKMESSGYGDITAYPGVARLFAEAVRYGRGEREEPLNLLDVAKTIFGMAPAIHHPEYGLAPTKEEAAALVRSPEPVEWEESIFESTASRRKYPAFGELGK